MMDEINCPNCAQVERVRIMSQNFPDIYLNIVDSELNKITRYWYECSYCSFLYRSPKLTKKEQELLYEKYRDETFRSETSDEYFDRISQYSNSKSENFQKVSWFIKNAQKSILNNSKTVLDVGCGGGVLLHKIKELLPSLSTYGVEPNKSYSDLARRRSGAEEILTSYFDSDTIDKKFDIIMSCDVLEHVDSPEIFLNDVYTSLNSTGIFFLEVPSPTNFNELRPDHDMFNIAHHVFYTSVVLKEYLVDAGFVNIMIEDIRLDNNVWKLRSISYRDN
ncbi:class I SAM-dependent methyltransferase [Candidatus Pseudothioglobus singularis]|nr:class I SAM-dependent methyltransferase [Candidatus Pseudothioglobus singularis]